MNAKERILAIRLAEKINRYPLTARQSGIDVKNRTNKNDTTIETEDNDHEKE